MVQSIEKVGTEIDWARKGVDNLVDAASRLGR
jgi:hypothetical protein